MRPSSADQLTVDAEKLSELLARDPARNEVAGRYVGTTLSCCQSDPVDLVVDLVPVIRVAAALVVMVGRHVSIVTG